MILLAGVGYSHLSDLSFGPLLIERMRAEPWPDGVEIEDLSYGPIGVIMWLEDQPRKFDHAILAGAVERGRPPGTLDTYRWISGPDNPDEVQARVAEAVTGVIGLENLLVVADHFGVLPPYTSVVELEPLEHEWGLEMSPVGQKRLEEALGWIRDEINNQLQAPGNGRTLMVTRDP